MLARLPRPFTEALGGVASALVALGLGAPWWALVATYLVASALVALAVDRSRRPRARPLGSRRLLHH